MHVTNSFKASKENCSFSIFTRSKANCSTLSWKNCVNVFDIITLSNPLNNKNEKENKLMSTN